MATNDNPLADLMSAAVNVTETIELDMDFGPRDDGPAPARTHARATTTSAVTKTTHTSGVVRARKHMRNSGRADLDIGAAVTVTTGGGVAVATSGGGNKQRSYLDNPLGGMSLHKERSAPASKEEPTPLPDEVFEDEKDITLEIGTSRSVADAPDEFDEFDGPEAGAEAEADGVGDYSEAQIKRHNLTKI